MEGECDESLSPTEHDDPLFRSIQDQISSANSFKGSSSTLMSDAVKEDGYQQNYSDNFTHVPYGFQPRLAYLHPSSYTDIMGLSYNGRMRQFIVLDSKGVTLWNKDALDEKDASERPLHYPKYEYRLITNIVYARKYNVYFALGKDFALKVLNRDFQEICHVRSDLQSILFMIFNPVRDELITGGVAGTKVWSYKQAAEDMWTEIKHMANYKLVLKYELKNVGGSWVKRVDLDLKQQHLYCCSDMDLYAYDMEGKLIFKFERAHSMSITGCVYSSAAKQFLTVSADCDMKVWSPTGGLVHTFRGHARAISNVILHPENAMLVITSSLDGSVRLWSLDTMECLYTHVVSTEGILWMGVTEDHFLYVSTMRTITLWSFNTTHSLWALARNQLTHLSLVPGEGKSTRVLAVCEDSSVRVFSRKTHKNLSTVLPPPVLSPMQRALCVVYNRVYSVAYMLITSRQIWVYTTRTDPACRIAEWDVFGIQQEIALGITGDGDAFLPPPPKNIAPHSSQHRATLHGTGKDGMAECLSLCYLNSPAVVWTEDEGLCCPSQHVYLLFGLADGRILFMDPVVRAKKYFEFRANKDSVVGMRHDTVNNCLMTMCDLHEAYHVQVWSLPQLTLSHQVFTAPDITGYIRLNSTLVTAHKNGGVICHELLYVEDAGFSTFRPKFDIEETSSTASFDPMKVEHNGPVLSIDACHKLEIFATCSADGVIKVWQENKVLLTEIQLAESLNSASFLNDRGDLLVGFKNHIFFIDSKKVCPSIEKTECREEEDEVESDVYEDPAVLYEGVVENPDPIDLDNYLVPFDIDFSKDFIEGKKPLIPPKEDEDGDDAEDGSELSWAPTDIYQSPFDTPRRLSMLDLTLTPQASKYDLRKSMADIFMNTNPLSSRVAFVDEEDDEMKAFEFPQFGISPGPTPSPSTPSCTTPSDFDVSEGGESTECEEEEGLSTERTKTDLLFTPIDSAKESTPAKSIKTPRVVKELKELEQQTQQTVTPRSKLSIMRIDSKALMQTEAKRQKQSVEKIPGKDDHGHKELVNELKTQRKKEAVRKREDQREKKAAKAAEKRKKKKPPSKTAKKVSSKEESSDEESVPKSTSSSRVSKKSDKEKKEQPKVESSPKRTITVPEPQLKPRLGASPTPDTPAKRIGSSRSRTTLIGEIAAPRVAEDGREVGFGDFDQFSEVLDDIESQGEARPGSTRPLSGVKVGFKDSLKGDSQSELHDGSLPRLDTPGAASGLSTYSPDPEHGSLSAFGGTAGRSMSPTIYSDYGSEWTVPAPEDSAQSRLQDFHWEPNQSDYIRRMREELLGRPVTSVSYAARPNTPAEGVPQAKTRPHTALPHFTSKQEEVEFMFREALNNYRGIPGTDDYVNHLYENAGTRFGERYHDKLIERHQLIRIQRNLRAQSAKERRNILELRKREANKRFIGHKNCDEPTAQLARPDTRSQLLSEFLEANLPPKSPSPPKNPVLHPSIPNVRAKSARNTLSKNQVLTKAARPKTAPTFRGGQSALQDGRTSAMEQRKELSKQRPYRHSLGRPKSAISVGSQRNKSTATSTKNTSNRERVAIVTVRNRWKMKEERFDPTVDSLPKSGFREEDLKLFDPRNPMSRLLRGQTKSIPSKCSHYILVNRNRHPDYIVPTPVEEQLILDRFPEWQEKWIGPKLRHHKPALVQKVHYSPEALT